MRLLAILSSLLLLVPASTALADGLEEEATRQASLCRDDFAAGLYERAIAACDSALRLDPSREVQQEAFKLKGLALEGLGRLDDARGMLLACKSLRSGLPDDLEVEDALARIDRAQATARQAERPARGPREPRPAPRPPPEQVLVPLLVTIAGAGASGAGWALHGGSYQRAARKLDADEGLYFGSRASYEPLYEQNKLGLQIGVAGAGIAGAGLVLTILSAAREARVAAAPLPWMGAGPTGAVVGVMGELP